MTRYSSTTKKPNQFLKGLREHFLLRRKGEKTSRSGGINECWKPSNEASKADLKEFHQEEIRLRCARRRSRLSDHRKPDYVRPVHKQTREIARRLKQEERRLSR
jgi:hypothetical protein